MAPAATTPAGAILSALGLRKHLRFPQLRSRNLLDSGVCEVCGATTEFHFQNIVPEQMAETAEFTAPIREAWDRRESMSCLNCHTNYRGRQIARAILKDYGQADHASLGDLVGQETFRRLEILVLNDNLFHPVLSRHPGCEFSDYIISLVPAIGPLDNEIPRPDATVDLILSSDAIEHTPAYMHALQEMQRILKPGGAWIACLPLLPERRTRTRAVTDQDGNIVSLLPPSYHCRGELDSLVFVEFGSDFLARIESVGLKVEVYFYSLLSYDYSSVFVCRKQG